MEDAHIACTEVAHVGGDDDKDMVALFGVFDGHGGMWMLGVIYVY